MKKLFTFIFATALAVSCWGTETIQVGSGTGTTTQYMPLVTGSFNYNHITQQLYLASEIGGTSKKGDISSIAFYSKDFSAVYTSEYSDSRRTNFKIYVTTVASTTTTLSNWVNKGTEVYSSNQQAITSGAWTTFEFSKDFTWNGTDNIVVTIVDESNKRAGTAAKNFYAFDATSRGLYACTNSGTPISFEVTPTAASVIPQIRFEIETGGSSPTLTVDPTSTSLGTFDVQYEQISTSFVVKGSDLTDDVTISSEATDITISPTSITKEAIAAAGETGVEVTITNKSTFDFKKSHKVTVASTGATSQDVSISGSAAQYTAQSSYTYLYNTEVGSYSTLAGPTEIASVDASAQTFVLGTTSNACTIDYSAVPGTYVALGKVSNLKVKKTGTGTFKAFAFDYSATSITIDEAKGNNQITYGTTANVTLNRTLVQGTYNTICLPFAVNADDITIQFGTGTEVKKLTSASLSDNDTELELNFADTTGMKAGVPYLIKPTDVKSNTYTFNGVTLDNTLRPFISTNLDFIGTFNKSDITVGDKNVLLLSTGNNLLWASDGSGFKGMRAYFKVKYHGASAPANVSARMTFNNSQQTTQIQAVSKATQCSKMIIDGKLVIIRNGILYNANGARL